MTTTSPPIVPSKSITLEILSTFRGHKIGIFVEDTDDLAERAKLAEKVNLMIKDGYDVFLVDKDRITFRIKEYDAKENEWVVYATRVETPTAPIEDPLPKRKVGRPKKGTARVSADGTKTTAVARSAGG
jgi:hypothetical protein